MAIDVRGVCPLLQVYDMPTALKFYRDVLGFEVVGTSPELGPDKYQWMGRMRHCASRAWR